MSESKPVRARKRAPFFGPDLNIRSSVNGRPANPAKCGALVPHRRRSGKAELLDGIVDGERVLIAPPDLLEKGMSERAVELRVRIRLAAEGIFVRKHTVEACPVCHARPRAATGLGKGTSDLFCIVPPFGRALFIEMKRPGYRPSDVSKEQKDHIRSVRLFGGVAGVASSEDEAMVLVNEARRIPGRRA